MRLRGLFWVNSTSRPSPDESPVDRQPGWTPADKAEWERFAIEQGVRFLDDQNGELARIRERAITFVAFISAAVALLVAGGIAIQTRPLAFFIVAGVGTAGLAFMAFWLARVVSPSTKFRGVLRPDAVLDQIYGDEPKPNITAARTRLAAVTLPGMIDKNETALKTVRGRYSWLLWTGNVTLLIWSALIWVFA